MPCRPRLAFASIARQCILNQISKFQIGIVTIKDADDNYFVCGDTDFKQGDKDAEELTTNVLLEIKRPQVWTQMLLRGDLGFAEAYMRLEAECDDLPTLFELIIINRKVENATPIMRWALDLIQRPARMINDLNQASINANAHYSLSNEMFMAFLSPDMTYSCPIWDEKSATNEGHGTLEEAQHRKLKAVVDMAEICATDHVLEIGTGWASFAILACQKTGCQVTTITLSSEQKKLAEERIKSAGLEQRIKVLLCDYRRVSSIKPFDKIVSIEMIEHVGEKDIDTCFKHICHYLKPGGIFVLQTTIMPESGNRVHQGKEEFIEKYIFPGGYLPPIRELRGSIYRTSRGKLSVVEEQYLGPHYVRALKIWRQNFEDNFQHVIAPALTRKHHGMKVEDVEVFRRKWIYYFTYCEAGFNTGVIDNVIMKIVQEQ